MKKFFEKIIKKIYTKSKYSKEKREKLKTWYKEYLLQKNPFLSEEFVEKMLLREYANKASYLDFIQRKKEKKEEKYL